jgi:hypothetical protein
VQAKGVWIDMRTVAQPELMAQRYQPFLQITMYRVFHFEVSISAPRLDLGSKSQQILTLTRAKSTWNFQPLGAKARAMTVDFSDALDVKPVR